MQNCTQVLSQIGITGKDAEELLAYNQRTFPPLALGHTPSFLNAIAPEPHIDTWQAYEYEAKSLGAAEVLTQRLIQLQFPIQAGISETATYQAATRRGIKPDPSPCSFHDPNGIILYIYPSLVGPIPVITAGCRADFVTLVQSLTKRNEPQPISPAMGACIVSGYNNWDRIHRYRQTWRDRWLLQQSDEPTEADWNAEFAHWITQKNRYQDRFIILSSGPYSHLNACDLGLTDAQWLAYSQTIRLEHECTHYFTLRVFQSMQNHVLDELIADYRGIVAALGHYRADWFLQFMGLESEAGYRQGGRLEQYRGTLSDRAFHALQQVVRQAAHQLEQFDQQLRQTGHPQSAEMNVAIALTQFTLLELAAPSGASRLAEAVQCIQENTRRDESMAYCAAEGRHP